MHRRPLRTALTSGLAATALAAGLTGCIFQPEEANDNGPQPDPVQPEVVRTPEAVEDAPAVVEEVPAEKQAEVPEAEAEDD